jgi:alginate O-acetyltransferase complex protein AlgI
LIADRLALFVDPVFADPEYYSTVTVWLAVVSYGIQIYCDFSGYSDMAIGSARCFGFEIPPNFNMPYISRSITEFWRRWHISLSNWLKDYLYISLGGNRQGEARQYLNLIIVMLLGGLWHGASWNFVIWGGLHGIALMTHKLYVRLISGGNENDNACTKTINWFFTFLFVQIAWIFFRSQDIDTALFIIRKLFFLSEPNGINWFATSLFISAPILVWAHYFGNRCGRYPAFRLTTFNGLFCTFFVLLALIYLRPLESSPFIYFQF